MLCFGELTNEHNIKKNFQNFSFCLSISLNTHISLWLHVVVLIDLAINADRLIYISHLSPLLCGVIPFFQKQHIQ